MDLVMVIIRTVFFYLFVLVIFRLMGKREIGELSIQDLVVSLLIAELVAISIENYKDSMLLTVIPILILLFFEIVAGYLSLRFNKFRNIMDGKPVLIINRGIINYKEMMKQRYSLDEKQINEILNQEQAENENIYEIMQLIGKKRGAILGGRVDDERTSKLILDDFRSSKLGKITLEIPE